MKISYYDKHIFIDLIYSFTGGKDYVNMFAQTSDILANTLNEITFRYFFSFRTTLQSVK